MKNQYTPSLQSISELDSIGADIEQEREQERYSLWWGDPPKALTCQQLIEQEAEHERYDWWNE